MHLPSDAIGRDERSNRLTAAFEWPMLIASLLVVPTIAIENAGLSPGWTAAAKTLNWLIWIAFATEFAVLLAVSPRRGQWLLKHPLEFAIVLLTPPFGPAALQSARAFRLLRLLRLLRVAKLARSLLSLDGVKWAALIAFLLIEACGVALVIVEGRDHHPHLSIVDGLWWAMTTVTTVGYGDITAVTNAGRLIGMCIMVVGLGFVAIVTGAVAQYVVARETAEAQDASTNDLLGAIHELRSDLQKLAVRLEHLEPGRDRTGSSPQHGPPRSRRSAPEHAGRTQAAENSVD